MPLYTNKYPFMNHSLTDIVSLTVNEASQVKSILNIYILYTHASNKVPK